MSFEKAMTGKKATTGNKTTAGKIVRAGKNATVSQRAIAGAAASIAALNVAYAQATEISSADPAPTDEMIISATRTPRTIEKVAASVVVIDEIDIKNIGAQTLKDVIARTPGLTIQFGSFPAASSASKSSISVRGLGATGTLWLLDGRRLAGEVTNPYDMDRLPASMIERIEVVKGPMSALYGADAIGGVVNIITKRPQDGKLQGGASARYGSNLDGEAGQFSANGDLRVGVGPLRLSAYASYQDSGAYDEREATDTRIGSGRHRPSEIPPVPGYLNPRSGTRGNPFYFRPPGSVTPQPLDPSLVVSDRAASQASFDAFRNRAQSQIADSYEFGVTYREAIEVLTLGGRAELDLASTLTAGFSVNWFDEEREGAYRASFHPTSFPPPGGVNANPIVGHRPDGSPIFFTEAQGRALGQIPVFDVPTFSYDDNQRLDLSGDLVWTPSDALRVSVQAYHSDYEKRNDTTLIDFAAFGYASEAASAASGLNANVGVTGVEAVATYQIHPRHTITVGGEYRDEDREATVFKQPRPGEDPFDERSVSFRAGFIQDEWAITDDLNLTVGLRYEDYEQDAYVDASGVAREASAQSETTVRAGLVQNFSPAANVRAVFAQGFRAPDLRELFIQRRTPAGLILGAQAVDPSVGKTAYDLSPETTNAYELGFFGADGAFSL